jgi:hypothetical protein
MSTPVVTHEESQPPETDLPADYGLLSGVTTFFLGFALTYSWTAHEVESALSGLNAVAALFGETTIPTWKAVGWGFYNAHLVAVEIPLPGGTVSRDLIAAQGGPVGLYLVVPVMLTLAGFLVARQAGNLPSLRAGARAGSTVVVGYLLVAVAGAFALSADAFGSTVGPDLLGAAAVAGLLYPLLFGALGGAVAAVVD